MKIHPLTHLVARVNIRIRREYFRRIFAPAYYRSLPKQEVSCGICNSTKNEIVVDNDRYNMKVSTVCCNNCGFIFVNPRPSPESMAKFYRDDYRKFYESIESPSQDYIKAGKFEARAAAAVDMVKKAAAEINYDILRVLDIGCAQGTVLDTLKKNGVGSQFVGIEPSPTFAQYARELVGCHVFNGTLDEFQKTDNGRKDGFNLVLLSHVLEHFNEPVYELKRIHGMLDDGGLLYVEVPNVCSSRGAGMSSFHLAHLSLFYPETLVAALKEAGFEVLSAAYEGLPAACPSMAIVGRKKPERQPWEVSKETI